jgi:chemotaxis protein MotA
MILNWIGIILGIFAIVGGAVLEGLHIESLIQPTAAIIVFGGTIGATMLASTMAEFSGALRGMNKIFLKGTTDYGNLVKELVSMANIARKDGILALEKMVESASSPFLAENLRKVVDGYDPNVLKEMMEDRIYRKEEEINGIGKVWETAGGFSPTIGIIGAVLGLIHVMGNLSDSSKLGSGIAVAFVATVYGVGSANLVFIPMGNKLKKIGKEEVHGMELIATALLGIQAGLNPRLIEDKLNNILGDHAPHDEEQKKAA